MSIRQRTTWGGKQATGPLLPIEKARRASAHPQTPDEGLTHPAGYTDPEADAYENGDTSAWGEDVNTDPVRTSPQPANPMDDGGYRHPAAQAGAPAKNASRDVFAAAERKAELCLRIAEALLGKQATGSMLEDQAFDFMAMSDTHVASTLRRLEASTEDEDTLLRRMLAAEGEEEEEAEEPAKTAAEDKLAQVLTALSTLQAQINSLQAPKAVAACDAPMLAGVDHEAEEMLQAMMQTEAPVAAGVDHEAEEMLQAMMQAEAPVAAGVDHEAEDMLQAMMQEEAAKVAEIPVEAPATAGRSLADFMEDEMVVEMDALEDPMGLMMDDSFMGEDDALLANLFASDDLKVAGDEDEEEEEKPSKEGQAKQARVLTARLNPQPKKASKGARTVGTQVRTAGTAEALGELSRLWESAPNVDKVFNS